MRDPGFVQTFNRIAPRYDRRFGDACRPAQTLCLSTLESALGATAPTCVLDIGCGTGVLLAEIRRRWPGTDLVGLDPAERMLAVAKERLPDARLLLGPAERIPVPSGTVAVVVSTTSFGHWPDKPAAIREIRRVLHPGGFACVVEHLPPGGLVRLLYQAVRRLPDYRSPAEVRELAVDAGLEVLRCQATDGRFLVTLLRRPVRDGSPA